jgi:hypothetical protein
MVHSHSSVAHNQEIAMATRKSPTDHKLILVGAQFDMMPAQCTNTSEAVTAIKRLSNDANKINVLFYDEDAR